MKAIIIFCTVCFSCIFVGCNHKSGDMPFDVCADSFATNYFNWRLADALPYCTPESKIWLRYAASQVHQADIDVLHKQTADASHAIEGSSYTEGDTVAVVALRVKNFMRADTIGKEGRIIADAKFNLRLVRRGEKWLVHLNGLPRMEKR